MPLLSADPRVLLALEHGAAHEVNAFLLFGIGRDLFGFVEHLGLFGEVLTLLVNRSQQQQPGHVGLAFHAGTEFGGGRIHFLAYAIGVFGGAVGVDNLQRDGVAVFLVERGGLAVGIHRFGVLRVGTIQAAQFLQQLAAGGAF